MLDFNIHIYICIYIYDLFVKWFHAQFRKFYRKEFIQQSRSDSAAKSSQEKKIYPIKNPFKP